MISGFIEVVCTTIHFKIDTFRMTLNAAVRLTEVSGSNQFIFIMLLSTSGLTIIAMSLVIHRDVVT